MKVAGLVSGGKDSCYNLMQCVSYGHEVVALANLYPPDAEVDELDSFMFQTVAHNLIEALAECTGLPLYRRKLLGRSTQTSMAYTVRQSATQSAAEAVPAERDEVEDLYELLADVKRAHPEVAAVSCGAIMSSYQRLRVENVCGRLGLTSLCYLWQRPQAPLLAEMIACGVHAVIVKVAVMGLDARHVGKSLGDLQPLLASLAARFGMNVCGEGGEYETFTLDCPLFRKGRIVLEAFETFRDGASGIAPVVHMRPTRFRVEPRRTAAPNAEAAEGSEGAVGAAEGKEAGEAVLSLKTCPGVKPYPGLLLPAASALACPSPVDGLWRALFRGDASPEATSPSSAATSSPSAERPVFVRVCASGTGLPTADATAAEAATHAAFDALVAAAARRGLRLPITPPTPINVSTAAGSAASAECEASAECALVYVDLSVSDMGGFATVNAAYKARVPQGRAPARACVQPVWASPVVFGDRGASEAGAGAAAGKEREAFTVVVDALLLLPPRSPSSASPSSSSSSSAAAAAAAESSSSGTAAAAAAARSSVLHVQSVSAWAPANIGPYAQAVSAGQLVLLAGQIGLDPGLMTLVPAPAGQLRQAFRNAAACLAAVGVAQGRGVLACTVFLSRAALTPASHLPAALRELAAAYPAVAARLAAAERKAEAEAGAVAEVAAAPPAWAEAASDLFRELLLNPSAVGAAPDKGKGAGNDGEGDGEDEDDDGAGDDTGLIFNAQGRLQVASSGSGGDVDDDEEDDEGWEEGSGSRASPSRACPIAFVVVEALPRGALLEVQPHASLETTSLAGLRQGAAARRWLAVRPLSDAGGAVLAAQGIAVPGRFVSVLVYAAAAVSTGGAIAGDVATSLAAGACGLLAELCARAGLDHADALLARVTYHQSPAAGSAAQSASVVSAIRAATAKHSVLPAGASFAVSASAELETAQARLIAAEWAAASEAKAAPMPTGTDPTRSGFRTEALPLERGESAAWAPGQSVCLTLQLLLARGNFS